MIDNLAMHLLGLKPNYIKNSDIPEEVLIGWKNNVNYGIIRCKYTESLKLFYKKIIRN